MTFGRRLRLFMLGLGLGTILSFMIFGRSCTNVAWAPDARVRLRMKTTLVHATPRAQTAMDALGIDLAALRASMDSLDVDFSKSRRTEDSLYYELSGPVKGRSVQLSIATLRDYAIDSTSTLLMVGPK
jgi:hypothetical protein